MNTIYSVCIALEDAAPETAEIVYLANDIGLLVAEANVCCSDARLIRCNWDIEKRLLEERRTLLRMFLK